MTERHPKRGPTIHFLLASTPYFFLVPTDVAYPRILPNFKYVPFQVLNDYLMTNQSRALRIEDLPVDRNISLRFKFQYKRICQVRSFLEKVRLKVPEMELSSEHWFVGLCNVTEGCVEVGVLVRGVPLLIPKYGRETR